MSNYSLKISIEFNVFIVIESFCESNTHSPKWNKGSVQGYQILIEPFP